MSRTPIRAMLRRLASRMYPALVVCLVGGAPLSAQQTHYHNPIIPGDWSDPGVVRVGETYYSVRSTFGWQPGLAIAESRDLVNWRYAGHVDLGDVPDFRDGETAYGVWGSELVWNPNTRRFVVYNPLRETDGIVAWQADSPAGPWDGPYHIAFAIDPGVFVDDVRDEDGNYRLYVSFAAEGAIYELTPDGLGIRDPDRIYGPRITGYVVAGAEGPEIVKRDGWYYFVYSTDGTLPWEAYNVQTARTRDLRNGPWEFDPANPQMLANSYSYAPFQGPGHGELLEMPDGRWYATHHVYEVTHYSLGRQKALSPIEWTEDGWWRPRSGQIPPPTATRPALPWTPQQPQDSDEFDYAANRELGVQWFWNHRPAYDGSFWSVEDRPGWLRIRTQPGDIASADSRPNVFLQRVRHKRFDVTARVDFDARDDGEAAGLHFYHDPRQSFWLVSTAEAGRKVFRVGRYWWDADAQLARREELWQLANEFGRDVHLQIRVDGEETATFWVGDAGDAWRQVGGEVYFGDGGRDLRDGRSGRPDLGWVGQWTRGNNRWTAATFGVFAVRDGAPASRDADFDFVRVASRPYINHPRPVPGDVAAEPAFRYGAGDPISIPLSVHGGRGPYRWSAVGLPEGLLLDAATGRIHSTTPAPARGRYRLAVTATDATGAGHTRAIVVGITAPTARTVDCDREHREPATIDALPGAMRAALDELLGDERLDDSRTRIARITTCGAYAETPWTVFEMTGATRTRTFALRALDDGTIVDNQTKPRGTPAAVSALAPEIEEVLRRAVRGAVGERHTMGSPVAVRDESGETSYRVGIRVPGRILTLRIARDGRVVERWERHSFFSLAAPLRATVERELAGRTNPWLEIWAAAHEGTATFRVEIRDTVAGERVRLHFDRGGELTDRSATAIPTP